MKINVHTLTGYAFDLDVNLPDTVERVKNLIRRQEGTRKFSHFSLVYHNFELQDKCTLAEYSVPEFAQIALIPVVKAGPASQKLDSAVDGGQFRNLRGIITPEPPSQYFIPNSHDPTRVENLGNGVIKKGRWTMQTFYDNAVESEEGSASIEMDLTFTDEKRQACYQRAKDNTNTMEKMKQLRQNIERLNLEKAKKSTAPIQDDDRHFSGAGSMPDSVLFDSFDSQDMPPCSSSASRGRRSSCTPGKGKMVTKLSNSSRVLSAPEDTSAKESSAGETEYEEQSEYFPLALTTCPMCKVPKGQESHRTFNLAPENRQRTGSGFDPTVDHHAPLTSKKSGFRMVSSSSDVELDPDPCSDSPGIHYRVRRQSDSALLSDDADLKFFASEVNSIEFGPAGAVGKRAPIALSEDDLFTEPRVNLHHGYSLSDTDDHYTTASQYDNVYEERDDQSNEECVEPMSDCELAPPSVGPGTHRVTGLELHLALDGPVVADVSAEGTPRVRPTSDDPSELSSGMIICEHPDARRLRVRRKTKYTPAKTVEKADPPTFSLPTHHNFITGPHQSRLQNRENIPLTTYCAFHTTLLFNSASMYRQSVKKHVGFHTSWTRSHRPRSKPRFVQSSIKSNNLSNFSHAAVARASSTTGDSSSDEKHRNDWDNVPKPKNVYWNSRKSSAPSGEFFKRGNAVSNKMGRFSASSNQQQHQGALSMGQNARSYFNSGGSSGGGTGGGYNMQTSFAIPSTASPFRHTLHKAQAPQSSQSQQRCNKCGFKLSMACTFHCRCGKTFCSKHRLQDTHDCKLLDSKRSTGRDQRSKN